MKNEVKLLQLWKNELLCMETEMAQLPERKWSGQFIELRGRKSQLEQCIEELEAALAGSQPVAALNHDS